MPQWIRKIIFRNAALKELQGRQCHEWAEFNLPTSADLQILYRASAADHRGHSNGARPPGKAR
jgi:hypothetical protein